MFTPNISKIAENYVKNMDPAQAGDILINVLKQFDKLPVKQQVEIRTLLKSIMETR